jgi:hypothetical protein
MQEFKDQGASIKVKQVGYLWTWWMGDELPLIPPLADWHVETSEDIVFVAKLSNIPVRSVEERYRESHRPAIAYLDDTVVAYGWLAQNNTNFGSPSVSFYVPENNLYLYHFVTMLPWRGRGFYPRLLQEIIVREEHIAERFWIIHQYSNQASRKGIAKAGFHIAAHIFHTPTDSKLLAPDADLVCAQAGAELLGLPLIDFRCASS